MTEKIAPGTQRLTIPEIEEAHRRMHAPGGNYRYENYSRSTLLGYRRDTRKWLAEAEAKRRPRDAARLRGTLAGIEECLEAGKADAKYDRRVTYRQEGGDDGYQYVVRVDGGSIACGLTRDQAQYYKRQAIARLKKEAEAS